MADTIQKLFKHKDLVAYKSSKAVPIPAACPSLFYGLELEIENVPHYNELLVSGMISVPDGSLRNNGREFITSPASISVVNQILTTFFERAKLTKENYSDRCSVHVHANCLDLTLTQLLTLFLVYQTVEDLLFNFIGDERNENIYCVPWSQTNLGQNINNRIEHTLRNVGSWTKYTALNMLPIATQGSVEFRHMAGTSDKERIILWCNLIGCLFEYAKNVSYDDAKQAILSLNSSSQYRKFLDELFRQWADFVRVGNYEAALEDGVLNAKYLLVTPLKKKPPVADTLNVEQLLAQLDAQGGMLPEAVREQQIRPNPERRPTMPDDVVVVENHVVGNEIRLRGFDQIVPRDFVNPPQARIDEQRALIAEELRLVRERADGARPRFPAPRRRNNGE